MSNPNSYTVHIEPETEALLQEVHQLAMKRSHHFISFDKLIKSSLGAYRSVINSQINRKMKEKYECK
jgi:hypothetical protein